MCESYLIEFFWNHLASDYYLGVHLSLQLILITLNMNFYQTCSTGGGKFTGARRNYVMWRGNNAITKSTITIPTREDEDPPHYFPLGVPPGISVHTRMLSRLILAFLERGTCGRGETCFKGIAGSWDSWQEQGDLEDGEAFESNTKLFLSKIWRRFGDLWYPLSELLEMTVESVWLVRHANTAGKVW